MTVLNHYFSFNRFPFSVAAVLLGRNAKVLLCLCSIFIFPGFFMRYKLFLSTAALSKYTSKLKMILLQQADKLSYCLTVSVIWQSCRRHATAASSAHPDSRGLMTWKDTQSLYIWGEPVRICMSECVCVCKGTHAICISDKGTSVLVYCTWMSSDLLGVYVSDSGLGHFLALGESLCSWICGLSYSK